MSIPGRALHFVLKIADRAKTAFFYRNILGMQVLRHEEFTETCEAKCNGPYDNRWSKTMLGYGPEASHFVIELTYNYGVKSYELGNEFCGITIKSREVIERAKQNNYPVKQENNIHVLQAPDGYKFFVLDEPQPKDRDPIVKLTLSSTDLQRSVKYWHDLLTMKLLKRAGDQSAEFTFGDNQIALELKKISVPINRAKAYGRIAFGIPYDLQPKIDEIIKASKETILTPLVSLDTPDKATVRVIILADPDGHEICFVDEEGFSQLSEFDPKGNELLDRYIGKDPFQEK